MVEIVALIPARGGSKRIERKNIKPLAGHPLLAYTIAAAKQSGIFKAIFVSTEDEQIGRLALSQGDVCWIKRPAELAGSESPDIEWVQHAIEQETYCAFPFDAFAILRPTSPFRTADTIKRAWKQWIDYREFHYDSLRAVERQMPPPCKMWRWEYKDNGFGPGHLIQYCNHPLVGSEIPCHSRPSQALPTVWVQNASLEIAWTKTVVEAHSISGEHIAPFFTNGYEGFDLNSPLDWLVAETLIERGLATLPSIGIAAQQDWQSGYVD